MAKAVSTDSLAMEKKRPYVGKKLAIAFIGCGGIAQTHLSALKDMPEVEVVAGVDIDPDRLEVMQETWRVKRLRQTGKRCSRRSSPMRSASARPTAFTPPRPSMRSKPAAMSWSKSRWP